MVKQTTKTVAEVEFDEDEQQALENGESVEFVVGDTRVQVSFEDDEESERTLPSVGDTMYDDDAPHWSDGRVEVTNIPNRSAMNYWIPEKGCTVAADNPQYPTTDPVVEAKFVRESGQLSDEYAFPLSRLREENLADLFG